MSFTVNRVEYINNRIYDERVFALALASGIPNFVVDGLELDFPNRTITNGRGVNLGSIFTLGVDGETDVIVDEPTDEYYIVLETLIDGDNSTTTITGSTTFRGAVNSTATLKYFTIYKVDKVNDVILQDYRHINYVKSLNFNDLGDDEFSLSLNGFESQPFNTSVLQNAYTKSESDNLFGYLGGFMVKAEPVGVGDFFNLSSIVPPNTDPYLLGFSRIFLRSSIPTSPDVVLHFYDKGDGSFALTDKVSTNQIVQDGSQQKFTCYEFNWDVTNSHLEFTRISSLITQTNSPFIVEDTTEYKFEAVSIDNGKGFQFPS